MEEEVEDMQELSRILGHVLGQVQEQEPGQEVQGQVPVEGQL